MPMQVEFEGVGVATMCLDSSVSKTHLKTTLPIKVVHSPKDLQQLFSAGWYELGGYLKTTSSSIQIPQTLQCRPHQPLCKQTLAIFLH